MVGKANVFTRHSEITRRAVDFIVYSDSLNNMNRLPNIWKLLLIYSDINKLLTSVQFQINLPKKISYQKKD